MGECKLLEGFFAWSLQVFLFIMAIGALIVKRQYFENPQRTIQIWLMDVGKQSSAAGFAHVLNLLTAYLLSVSEKTVNDQCAWYFLNYLVDTTLGIPIAWFYLKLLTTVASWLEWTRLANTGDYGDPPSYKTWIYQILAWEFVVLLMKTSLGMVLYALRKPLSLFGLALAKPIAGSPDLELLIVMVLCPCIMNMIQFWIFDSLLKMKVDAVGPVGIEPLQLQIAQELEHSPLKKKINPPIEIAASTGYGLTSFLNKVKKGKKEDVVGLMGATPTKESHEDEFLEILKEDEVTLPADIEAEAVNELEIEDDVDLLLEEEDDQLGNRQTTSTTALSPSSS